MDFRSGSRQTRVDISNKVVIKLLLGNGVLCRPCFYWGKKPQKLRVLRCTLNDEIPFFMRFDPANYAGISDILS